MLLLNYGQKYGQKLLKTKNQEPDGQKKPKKNKGIANADKKNLSGQFFCPENFVVKTILLFGPLFCQDNFFVRTKGHLPPGRISPPSSRLILPSHQQCLFCNFHPHILKSIHDRLIYMLHTCDYLLPFYF